MNGMKSFKVLIIYLSIALSLWLLGADARAGVFPLSEKCRKCHERVYNEWVSSSMSKSLSSPLFKPLLEWYLSKKGPKDRGYCIQCHAPQARVNSEIVEDLIQQVQTGNVISDGVGCSQCHFIKEIETVKQNGNIRFELGRTLFGPYNDPIENMAHNSQFIEIYKKSDICLSCHQFKMAFLNGEECCDTFEGWKGSRAAREGKECQTCHMKERNGPSANEEKPRRIASHDFPGKYGEIIKDAVRLDMEKVFLGDQLKVTIFLQSQVPHNFPSGHPPFSQVFLNLSVRNQDYKTIFSATQPFRRVFEDKDGNKNVIEFNALRLSEDSIFKADELKKELFTIHIPKDTRSIEIEATLYYNPVADDFQKIKDLISEDQKAKKYLELRRMVSKIESIRFH